MDTTAEPDDAPTEIDTADIDDAPTEVDTADIDDAPTEIASRSDEGRNLDAASLHGNIDDEYGFLSREREFDQRQRSRSRTPTREEQLKRIREVLDRHAASIPRNERPYRSILDDMERQTVFLDTLPPDMAERASLSSDTMYYNFLYSGMGRLQKIARHLRCKYPGRHWASYLEEVSSFGHFCNTVDKMKQHMYLCNSSYKWGATEDLVRRWWDLGLHRSYTHLYYVVTPSLRDSAELEECLIRGSKSEKTPEIIRVRCENNTKGGEGLGQDHDSRSTVSGHFVYLAVAKNR